MFEWTKEFNDHSKKIYHEVVVEREGFTFSVKVSYEWLTTFCSHYKNIGHTIANCRWIISYKDKMVE